MITMYSILSGFGVVYKLFHSGLVLFQSQPFGFGSSDMFFSSISVPTFNCQIGMALNCSDKVGFLRDFLGVEQLLARLVELVSQSLEGCQKGSIDLRLHSYDVH